MNARRLFILLVTSILIVAVFVGSVNALNNAEKPQSVVGLNNVRDYAAAPTQGGTNYAVDAGQLFVGGPVEWTPVETPDGLIVSTVDVNQNDPATIYIGAANEMALYRSVDAGQSWERYLLDTEAIGGVTDVAVDSFQRLVYIGTDTAGVFRLRDVGSGMVVSSRLLLNEPVLEVAVDSTGVGLALARTEWTLYRAENFGLSWIEVDNLSSSPTAIEIANTQPVIAYVGTTDRGLLKSEDGGLSWTLANKGLGMTPGSRLQIDTLAIDPVDPTVLYVASSFHFGSSTVHTSPAGVAMSTDGAGGWSTLSEETLATVSNPTIAGLLPVSGETGAVYALTAQSRAPLALGDAPVITAEVAATTVETGTESSFFAGLFTDVNSVLAWLIAGLAAVALVVAIGMDLRNRGDGDTLVPELVSSNR